VDGEIEEGIAKSAKVSVWLEEHQVMDDYFYSYCEMEFTYNSTEYTVTSMSKSMDRIRCTSNAWLVDRPSDRYIIGSERVTKIFDSGIEPEVE